MSHMTNMRPRKAATAAGLIIIPLLALIFFGGLFLPARGFAAEDRPEATKLMQDAQNAYLKDDYVKAVAINLEIAEKHRGSEARRYAVQMLGRLYEENVVDLKKAIEWDREFLASYADYRQVPVYQEKLISLEKLMNQEQAFKTYQSIRFANEGDEVMVKKFEALLKEHPDFLLKDKVESELGYAYGRMDERKKSALAFKEAVVSEGKQLSASNQAAYETADRYWQMRTTWAWVAWAIIAILWAAVLLAKPWKQLTWPSVKRFLLWPVLWLALAAASVPFFYSMDTTGYPIVISAVAVYTLIGLNLIVLFWLLLLIKGEFWLTRKKALRWCSPALALLMTVGVFYLFVVYYPDGPYIGQECANKLPYLKRELAERHTREPAAAQDKGAATASVTKVKTTEGR